MAGMFGSQGGSGASAALAKYDPSQLSGSDKLMLLGAMLHDTGNSLRGTDSESVLNTQALLAGRQQMALQRAMMGRLSGLIGGQYSTAPAPTVASPPPLAGAQGGQGAPAAATAPGLDDLSGAIGQAGSKMGAAASPAPTPQPYQYQMPSPQAAGFDMENPDTQRTIAALGMVNPDLAKVIVSMGRFSRPEYAISPSGEAYDKYSRSNAGRVFAQPQAVNNTIVNMSDPRNINRVIPSAPVAGAQPVYDNQGRVTDWQLPPGAASAIAASQAVQDRHNRADEAIGFANASTGRMNARTSAGSLATTQATTPIFAPPPGFIIGHPGARKNGR